ncbi:fimbrial protein [Caballeronia insecticola]|uniref:Type-1 fimbrial protein A subunit n=1 Tax=Caballeronia insecticola TaxID=758793 RepID=R4WYQ8_9BURK|nr:fimbrial protein [Caballeronia insecticola]BAN23397.1 type-1 fimbrial protein A subunit [Caballeronia insecticola]
MRIAGSDLIQPQLIANSSLASPSTVNLDGQTYAVFKTGLAGIGVVLNWHPVYGGAASSIDSTYTGLIYEPTTDVPLTLAYTPVPTSSIVWNRTGLPQISTAIGVAVRARFVKIGTISGSLLPAKAATTFSAFVMGYNYGGTSSWAQFGSVPVLVTVQASPIQTVSCTIGTPNFTVRLGSLALSQFTGPGSIVGDTAFTINLNDCPSGLTSITYNLSPVNGAVSGNPGVMQLQPGSNVASGIGVRITDSNGVPVSFSTDTVFSSYTGAAGNYQIAFRAAYLQLSASVTAGTANAQLNYTIKYN